MPGTHFISKKWNCWVIETEAILRNEGSESQCRLCGVQGESTQVGYPHVPVKFMVDSTASLDRGEGVGIFGEWGKFTSAKGQLDRER